MYKILVFLFFFSCDSQCLKSLKEIDELKKYEVKNQEKFNQLVDILKTKERLIIFIDDNCIYVNKPLQHSELNEIVFEYLSLPGNQHITLLLSERAYDNNFDIIATTHSSIRKAYIKLWEDKSEEIFNKSLTELTFDHKSRLFTENPTNYEIRLDHIHEQKGQAIFDRITLELPPINPLLLERDTKGLN